MPKKGPAPPPRERTSFNDGWRFHRGDAPDADGALGYSRVRSWVLATGVELIHAGVHDKPRRPPGDPGSGVSFVRPGFDDSAWRSLDLPHDWGIEGPFDQELPGETGKLPWHGVGWYRKHFELAGSSAPGRLELEIEGAMSFSCFWLNGKFVGGWPYGYTSFRLDLTPYARFGADNVLAVRLDNPELSSRWYPGAGIYRNVWLVTTGLVRIAHGSHFVTTPRVSAGSALVNADAVIENLTNTSLVIEMTTRIYPLDRNGVRAKKPIAVSESDSFEIDPARARSAARSNLVVVPRPALWSLEERNRYVAVTTLIDVSEGDRVLDEIETPFGIRTVAVDPDRGFFLNGKRVALQGVCMHHDLGALGVAAHPRAIERQVEILKEMGANAIRTSHNPPAPELLDVCDRLGMLVLDEAFDCWRRGKKRSDDQAPEASENVRYYDYAHVFDDWHERDLRALVRRDRNHPSVVMWSIGNEVIEQWFSDGYELAQRLAGIVREEDRTRPITSAFNNDQAGTMGFERAVDVVGFNYKPTAYRAFHERHPTIPTMGAETASTISTRGEYFFPLEPDNKLHGRVNFQVSSYDLSTANWAVTPDGEFRGLDESPFSAGEFVWTGFDYLGEPTPYNADATNLLNFSDPEEREAMQKELDALGKIRVPSRSSYFGIIDLAGFPKDRFYIYQARWRPDLAMAHIVPHWSWPERVGQVTPVHVYSSGDEAELFLNGKSQGKRKKKKLEYRFQWNEVVYEPGVLEVVVKKRGKKWARAVTRTTSPAKKLVLSADRRVLRADGRDLSFVTVRVSDRSGTTVPRRHDVIRFSVTGPGDVVAVDNGDPTNFEPFQASERKAFNGLALAVVRASAKKSGSIRLRAEAVGLEPATVTLESRG
jgi:beta-galactosidase